LPPSGLRFLCGGAAVYAVEAELDQILAGEW
jgi:hypothetical protein